MDGITQYLTIENLCIAAEALVGAATVLVLGTFVIQLICRILGIQTAFWDRLDRHRQQNKSEDDDYYL